MFSFDAVICLFSSIGYLATVERLRTAVATMAGHLEPGGVLVVEPWILPEAWIEGRAPDVEVVEDGERKLVRVIATSRQDAASVLRIHYAVAAAGEIQTADERHQLRLFTHEWLDDSRLSGGQLSADAQQLQNGRPAGSGPIGCRSHSVGHSATHDTARRGSISWMAHPTLDVVSLPLAG